MSSPELTRREFLTTAVVLPVCASAASNLPAAVRPDRERPQITDGVQSGDVSADTAVVWARASMPARVFVEVSTTESFRDSRTQRGPVALPDTDLTAKTILDGLPPGQTIHYRVTFQDLTYPKSWGAPVEGSFKTPARESRTVRFAWAGDDDCLIA